MTAEFDPTKIDLAVDPRLQRWSGRTAHGRMLFDVTFMDQIEGNLWQGGCRYDLVLPEHIKHVVSLYPWERYIEKFELDSFRKIEMYDSVEQQFEQVDEIAEWVNTCCETGPTLVHCQAGLNRSSLIVARALMLRGWSSDKAITHLREVRSQACLSNASFERWLRMQDA